MSSCCYTSPPTFGIANFLLSFFNCSYSVRCVVVFHFNLQLPKDIWYWVSFNMLIWHLYIFFGGVSAQIFCPYCKCVCVFFFSFFLIVEFKSSFIYFGYKPFKSSFMYFGYKPFIRYMFCKYFLPVCGLFVILLTVSFVEQKFLIIMKSNSIIFLMDHALGCI